MRNIKLTPEIVKNINKLKYYSESNFKDDAKAYLRAVKEHRMICIIKSVSSSGMSRTLKFNSCEKAKERFGFRQYINMFGAMGYSYDHKKDAFRIGGCGMNMAFHTNYTVVHKLFNMGFISKKECSILEQATPTVL